MILYLFYCIHINFTDHIKKNIGNEYPTTHYSRIQVRPEEIFIWESSGQL